jgi:hypothetical protein
MSISHLQILQVRTEREAVQTTKKTTDNANNYLMTMFAKRNTPAAKP